MTEQKSKDPLHGVTLESMLNYLVDRRGWASMGAEINIRCFNLDPSIKSSLHFLRRTPWARKKVEDMYRLELLRSARAKSERVDGNENSA